MFVSLKDQINGSGSGFPELLVQRVLGCGGVHGNALCRELPLDVVAIKTPCRSRTAETAPGLLADAAKLQHAAVVELDLQHPGAIIVTDGARPARIVFEYDAQSIQTMNIGIRVEHIHRNTVSRRLHQSHMLTL
jgi:hypothetical protein